MGLFNLHACVTPYFKGNFVEIQALIITPILQNGTFVSFCRSGHICCLRRMIPVMDREGLSVGPIRWSIFWTVYVCGAFQDGRRSRFGL